MNEHGICISFRSQDSRGLPGEEWRETGHPSSPQNRTYEVSNLGRVRSVCRHRGLLRGRRTHKLLKPRETYPGAWAVCIYREGGHTNQTVGSLVLETFDGPRPEGHNAFHLNGDPEDNRLENLEWRDVKDIVTPPSLEARRKLTDDQVREIRRRSDEGEKAKDLGEEFGVHRVTIYHVAARRTWKGVPDEI
jgi:hypothetical protein